MEDRPRRRDPVSRQGKPRKQTRQAPVRCYKGKTGPERRTSLICYADSPGKLYTLIQAPTRPYKDRPACYGMGYTANSKNTVQGKNRTFHLNVTNPGYIQTARKTAYKPRMSSYKLFRARQAMTA